MTFANVFDYQEINSEKTTTSTAGVSYSKKKIKDIKIYNAIIKLADEEFTRVANLEKKQIRGFHKHLIADDKIAKLIKKLKLLHLITHGKNSKISFLH